MFGYFYNRVVYSKRYLSSCFLGLSFPFDRLFQQFPKSFDSLSVDSFVFTVHELNRIVHNIMEVPSFSKSEYAFHQSDTIWIPKRIKQLIRFTRISLSLWYLYNKTFFCSLSIPLKTQICFSSFHNILLFNFIIVKCDSTTTTISPGPPICWASLYM